MSAINHIFVDRIAPDVEKRIDELEAKFEKLVVVFGDCGTRGALDEVLKRRKVQRIAGPHCYEMYGGTAFHDLMEEEPGTFFLTDYMVRSWNGMIVKGMGLDRYPELKEEYFRHYKRLVYMVQKPDTVLVERAKAISHYLGLPLEVRATGYNLLEERLLEAVGNGVLTP